jgi:hypothetical protein
MNIFFKHWLQGIVDGGKPLTAILGLVDENMMLSEVDIFVLNGKCFTKADARTIQQP